MEEKKVYRLKKDLPDAKAGTFLMLGKDGDSYDYKSIDGLSCWYKRHFVENNETWFELVTPERIEVNRLGLHDRFLGNTFDTYWYQFSTNKVLDGTKFPLIKQAIEQALNNEVIEQKAPLGMNVYPSHLTPKYTEKDLLTAEENAFGWARHTKSSSHQLPHDSRHWLFPTFSEYKNRKNAQ